MASRRCWTWSTDRFALRALCALHMWLYVYMPRTICGVISTFLPYFHDFLSTCLLCLDVYSFTWSFDFLLGREWTRGLNKQGVGKFSEKQINGGWNKQRGGGFLFTFIPVTWIYQCFPIFEQSCNLWIGKKMLKQCENKFFRSKNMTW